jgi:hypothetical protein
MCKVQISRSERDFIISFVVSNPQHILYYQRLKEMRQDVLKNSIKRNTMKNKFYF